MEFELLTLTGTKYSGTVRQVSLATTEGDMGILAHHEPLTAVAAAGPVTITDTKGRLEVYAIFGGLLEVTEKRTRLLADEAEHAEDLVTSEIEAALAQARAMKSRAKDKYELARAQELIDRQVVRLGVAKMRRRRKS